MSIGNVVTRGFGLTPGSPKYIPGRGYLATTASISAQSGVSRLRNQLVQSIMLERKQQEEKEELLLLESVMTYYFNHL